MFNSAHFRPQHPLCDNLTKSVFFETVGGTQVAPKHMRFGFKVAWILFQHQRSTAVISQLTAHFVFLFGVQRWVLQVQHSKLEKKVIKIGIESTHTTPTKGKRGPDGADPESNLTQCPTKRLFYPENSHRDTKHLLRLLQSLTKSWPTIERLAIQNKNKH